jgi:tellurite resistance-related uncharacterized protein
MLSDVALPPGLSLARTTPEFTGETVPAGLLSAHRIASGVWGRLRVLEGSVLFVVEATKDSRVVVAGETQVIEPDVPHHVEVAGGARFVVEFYR